MIGMCILYIYITGGMFSMNHSGVPTHLVNTFLAGMTHASPNTRQFRGASRWNGANIPGNKREMQFRRQLPTNQQTTEANKQKQTNKHFLLGDRTENLMKVCDVCGFFCWGRPFCWNRCSNWFHDVPCMESLPTFPVGCSYFSPSVGK